MIILILTLLLPRTISPGDIISESREASYAYGGIYDAGYQKAYKIDAVDQKRRYVFYIVMDKKSTGILRTIGSCFVMQSIGLKQQVFLTPCPTLPARTASGGEPE